VHIVLNELSLEEGAAHAHVARQWLRGLVLVLEELGTIGVRPEIRTTEDIEVRELAPGYRIADWRNDSNVQLEDRLYFLTWATKAPYLLDVDPKLQYEARGIEVLVDGIGRDRRDAV
jgi:hypothetical protein